MERTSGHWSCFSSCLVGGRDKNRRFDLSPGERYLFPLPAAWGLHLHHQTKPPNVGSASLPPAKADDVDPTNHSSRSSTANQPITTAFLIQTALLRTNLRMSSIQQVFWELTSESLPRLLLVSSQHLLADIMKRRHSNQHQLQTTSSLT